MQVRGFVRYVNTGGAVPDGTEVQFRREADDSLIATTTTVGGMYEYYQNGSPGPYRVRTAIGDEVHITSSMVVGMSGPVDIGGIPLYFRLFDDGYIGGVLNENEVFAAGAAMQVSVRDGAHLVKGVLYDQQGTVNLTVDAADSQPRIDTVVIEVIQPGSGETVEGRTRLVVKKGTPAGTPTAPSLTQTTTIWEHPLADVRVDTGVSTVASNKVTDRRGQADVQIGDGHITNAMIATGTLDTRYYTENEVDLMFLQRKPHSDRGTYSADQTVSTAGIRQPTLGGAAVGSLGFSGLVPSTQYVVETSVAFRITGGGSTSASIGYQGVGAATSNALTTAISLPDNANFVTWTWSNIHTSSAGGAITVRPITSWGIGTYTITWVSISARLDIVT